MDLVVQGNNESSDKLVKYQLVTSINPSIFRAYDIRGIVGEGLTTDIIYTIARAIGSEVMKLCPTQIVMGRDGRLSSEEFSQALLQGLIDSGCEVIDVGEVPTPVLYFAAKHLAIQSSVMLTASHNPAEYNGLKIVINNQTLAEENIKNLWQRIVNKDFAQGIGQTIQKDIVEDYINAVLSSIHLKRPLKIVLDCGNGVAGKLAPALFRRLGCQVIELFCEVDGHFPNHQPDPTIVENLQAAIEATKAHQADLAVVLDGDADRLGVISNSGQVIWPDRQLMLYAQHVLAKQPGAKIVFDVKCSRQLANVIKMHTGLPVMWKTGHALLKIKMKEIGALLGGEMSGHIFFKEGWFGFDDGLYAGARLLEIVSHQNKSVDDLFSQFPDSVNTPELKCFVPESEKFIVMEKIKQSAKFPGANIIAIDGLRVEFTQAWGLVRVSNTSPCLIFRFEADDKISLENIMKLFKTELIKVEPQLKLPF